MWFYVSNPSLNGMRPIDYKPNGKWDALEKLILRAIAEVENERTEQQSSTDST